MQFEFDGKRYRIAFERRHKSVNIMRSGRVKSITSKHPYTTAKIFQLQEGQPPIKAYEATVGCFTQDTYRHAEGARQALLALSTQHRKANGPEGFRTAMWEAYNNRKGGTDWKQFVANLNLLDLGDLKDAIAEYEATTPKVEVTNEQKLLPEAKSA
jgi:hypothetical protein